MYHLKKIFIENISFITLFFILNFLPLFISILYTDNSFERSQTIILKIGYRGIILFFTTFILAVLLHLIKNKKIKKALISLIISLTSILFIIEWFTIYHFKAILNSSIASIILETNEQETTEFFSVYLTKDFIFSLLAIGFGIFLIYKIICRLKIPQTKFSNYLFYSLLLIGFISFAYSVFKQEPRNIDTISYGRAYRSFMTAQQDLKIYQNLVSNLQREVLITTDSSKIKNIVIIIGESVNRNHMSLYGHYLNTTPLLQKLFYKNDLIVYKNIVSAEFSTNQSLKRTLTFYNDKMPGNWYDYNNIIDIFNAAHYKTFWISNQESFGNTGNFAAAIANCCDQVCYNIKSSSQDRFPHTYDEQLLPLLDQKLLLRENKNLIIIHLMGSHQVYASRYPQKFSHFSADSIKSKFSQRKKQITAEYDNSILYNDYIISEIIYRFQDDEAIILYFADHGEEVYDDLNFAGHSIPHKTIVEIPMIIWTSKKFNKLYPEKFNKLKNAVNRKYKMDDFIHTALDISDINTPLFKEERSLIGENFDTTKQRLYGKWNYDLEGK